MFKNNQTVSDISCFSVQASNPPELISEKKFKESESEVIAKIVYAKFKNILNYYYQRSINRFMSHKKSTDKVNVQSDNCNYKDEATPSANTSLANEEEFLSCRWDTEVNTNENLHSRKSMDNVQEPTSSRASTEEISSITSHRESNDEGVFEENPIYDSQEFLKAALGDELYDSFTSYSSAGAFSERFPINTEEDHSVCTEEDHSICTDEVSELLSSAGSLYTTFSKPIKRKNKQLTSSPVYKQTKDNIAPKKPMSLDCKTGDLIEEAAIQHQVITQISKALNICLSSKEFRTSVEYIEAERILLIAEQKREAILAELKKVQYETLENLTCLGEAGISDIKFTLCEGSKPADNTIQWFVVILSHNTTVLASEVTKADKDGNISFTKSFKFEQLHSDFEIMLSIYSLETKNNIHNLEPTSKFHSKTETAFCGSNKFSPFCKNNNKHRIRHYSYERRNPSFVLCGTSRIHVADLKKDAPLKLTHITNYSKLQRDFTAKFSSNVKITSNYSGFLTVGTETDGCLTWSHRWCHLSGDKLMYWNYPTEQDVAEPVGSIDFSFCISSYVTRADREYCARPRTLFLEIGRNSISKDNSTSPCMIKKYYLSAENLEEMNTWKNKLNTVISALRSWDSMKCQLCFKK